MAAPTLDLDHPRGYVTDGGLETDLIFNHGVDLPEFAAFPLVQSEGGVRLLTDYFEGYAAVAAAAGAGLLLETPTWRANPDWGATVGYDREALRQVNIEAVELLLRLRERWTDRVDQVLVGGVIGPRGDGYRSAGPVDPAVAAAYHHDQIAALSAAGADLVTAYTLTEVGEAAGVVLAAREVGLPVAISFTVETDGRLPDGSDLATAIARLDALAPPDHLLVNCAHPSHVAEALESPAQHAPWRDRVLGLRCNASMLSHAELDEAEILDDGDPVALAEATARLAADLGGVRILGGCCGTDARHVAAMWGVAAPGPSN